MLCENGKAPLPGQIFKNPNLAKTFRKLGKEGKKGYYEGPIAEAIVEGESRIEYCSLLAS